VESAIDARPPLICATRASCFSFNCEDRYFYSDLYSSEVFRDIDSYMNVKATSMSNSVSSHGQIALLLYQTQVLLGPYRISDDK
jgi:hypothetical protein